MCGTIAADHSISAPSIRGPATAPISHPYWLREEPTAGMFRVADAKLIGQPENPPPFTVDCTFDVGDQKLVVTSEPLAPTNPGKPGRRLAVISPVSLRFASDVALFTPKATKTVEVEVTAARAGERQDQADHGAQAQAGEGHVHVEAVRARLTSAGRRGCRTATRAPESPAGCSR